MVGDIFILGRGQLPLCSHAYQESLLSSLVRIAGRLGAERQ